MRRLCVLLCCIALPTALAAQSIDLRLNEIAGGFTQPLFLTHAGDGSGRLFVVEQGGRVQVLRDGQQQAEPFLNVEGMISVGDEQGLLGLAFDPGFASNGRVYINLTNPAGGTDVVRYRVDTANPLRVDPASRRTLLAWGQPFPNHNGGWMGFGPDGLLYIACGDGGSGGDPQNHGQRLDTPLGKILRVDVSGEMPAIPPGNPFAGSSTNQQEIWAYGLRNPWRASFDRQTGDLWIADVGQSRTEEVNFQPAGAPGGRNYGWRTMEGSECRQAGCNTSGLLLPVSEYGRTLGCSITGGYVYRGQRYPAMQGRYFFGDFCSGRIFSLRRIGSGDTAASFVREEHLATGLPISSFGEDEEGNLYLVSYDGRIYLLSDGEPSSGPQIDQRFTGTWYDPAQSGHGLFLEVLPGNTLVAYWFTFDAEGRQAWFGGAGDIDGNRAVIRAVRTEGGRFPPNFDASQVRFPEFGTLTLSFESCRLGQVAFDLPGSFGRGTMRLERLTEPLGTACTQSSLSRIEAGR